jgi:hypothetical protein
VLKGYFVAQDDCSKRKELQEDMREFLKTIKAAQNAKNPQHRSNSLNRGLDPPRTKSASAARKKSANPSVLQEREGLGVKPLTRTLTVGSQDFHAYLILDESNEIGRGYASDEFK